jgi:flagellar hook-length control protein FliK
VRDALQAALASLTNGQGAALQASGAGTTGGGTADSGNGSAANGFGLASGHGNAKGAAWTTAFADAHNGAKDAQTTAAGTSTATTAATADATVKSMADALASNSNATQSNAIQAASGADAAHAAQALASAQAAATAPAQVVQQPGMAAAANAAALSPQVGTPDWEDALSQKVVFLTNAHQQTAELTLNPKDLGPLQVVLQVADNHAHALFVSQHQQVREAVEAALPKLREAMEAGGIGLGSASVSDGFARQTGQQAQQNGQGSSGSGRGNGGVTGTAGIDDGSVSAAATATVRRTVGMVDTFV